MQPCSLVIMLQNEGIICNTIGMSNNSVDGTESGFERAEGSYRSNAWGED